MSYRQSKSRNHIAVAEMQLNHFVFRLAERKRNRPFMQEALRGGIHLSRDAARSGGGGGVCRPHSRARRRKNGFFRDGGGIRKERRCRKGVRNGSRPRRNPARGDDHGIPPSLMRAELFAA